MNATRAVVWVIALFSLCAVVAMPVSARPVHAKAQTLFFYDGDPVKDEQSGRQQMGTSTWSLGVNTAIILPDFSKPGSAIVTIDPANGKPLTGLYKDGGQSVIAQRTALGSTATAETTLTVEPENKDANGVGLGTFPWAMLGKAETDVCFFGCPAAEAIARGDDPQFILSPGLFGSTISLGAGSGLFEGSPDEDEATTTFDITAPLLSGPLATIDLAVVAGRIDAIVRFASDPSLIFLNPLPNPVTGLFSPISARDVELLLEGASGLNSLAGIPSTLALFAFQYDLTGKSLPSDAAFGAHMENIAISPVPEPGTAVLVSLGLLPFFLSRYRMWRRRSS